MILHTPEIDDENVNIKVFGKINDPGTPLTMEKSFLLAKQDDG